MAGIANSAGMIGFTTNEQLMAEDRQVAQENQEHEDGKSPVISNLAGFCRTEWVRCRDAKQPIEREMLDSLRQREGRYTANKLQAIKDSGGSEIKMMLTDVKCRAAESVLHDILFGSGERPFSTESTDLPEMPEDIKSAIAKEAYEEMRAVMPGLPTPAELRDRIEQYEDMVRKKAKDSMDKKAERMEDHIDDEYKQGGWYEAMEEVIEDLITLKAGVLMGPEINMTKQLAWASAEDPAKPNAAKAVVTEEPRRKYSAVSPFDCYPAPESRSFQEGTFIHRRRMAPDSLYSMIGIPGFDETEIRKAIDQYGRSGHSDWLWADQERSTLEGRPYDSVYDSGNLIDVLSCWVKVQGKWLKEWGMEGIEDNEKWYEANVWLVGTFVIRATLNDDPLGERPYYSDSFVRIRNSPWGRGVPEIMTDLQDMCDSAARAISNNMGISSGPLVEMEVDRLADGEKVTQIYPWKIFQTTANKKGAGSPAIRFHQPDSHAQVLIGVFEFFSQLSDEYTGIPKYQYGDTKMSGAGSTASGLSMLMNASSRLFKLVIRNVDSVIIGSTKRTHREIMLYDDEFAEKGDVEVVAKASQALIHRETQQMRVNEMLTSTNNPVDFQLMGPEGRLELLRASMRGLDAVNVDKVLPSDDKLLLAAMSQSMAPPPEGEQPGTEPAQQPQEAVSGMAA